MPEVSTEEITHEIVRLNNEIAGLSNEIEEQAKRWLRTALITQAYPVSVGSRSGPNRELDMLRADIKGRLSKLEELKAKVKNLREFHGWLSNAGSTAKIVSEIEAKYLEFVKPVRGR